MKKTTANIINDEIKRHGQTTSEVIARRAKISRQAAHKYLLKRVLEKKLLKVGKTKKSFYVPYSAAEEEKRKKLPVKISLRNRNLQEDYIFDRLALTSDLIKELTVKSAKIFRYAFTEMVNNAIEHSKSYRINIEVYEGDNSLYFKVIDRGIGVFNSLKDKFNLNDDFEAIQELLKGKKTTFPQKHSGEGIFFTSKISDRFEISGNKTNLIIDNHLKDIFIREAPKIKGTRVLFQISKTSKKDLGKLFAVYAGEDYQFSKTVVKIKLFKMGEAHISRSHARRLLFDLDKFKTIILDFDQIKEIGQGFADEIFRIFINEHPDIKVETINACPAVTFMIKRVKSRGLQ